MLCYRCGSHVPDGSETCGTCGQKFALGLKPGPIAGFGTGTRRHRIAVESSPYKVGDVLADRYEIKDNVGAGPVGWVYKCLDRDIDVDVAVKVVSPRLVQAPEERQGLIRELRQARKLSHPNIVRVYEDGEDRERLFFTMQHLEGLTLRRIWDLRRQKGQLFALREVEPIIAQVAQALDAALATMSHGDLKPDNVIVLPDLLKITDFGLANALPRGPFMAAQKTGGVHRYLAPEFLHGERINPRADVFSLGVILGEMLAGSPFEGQGFDLLARNPGLPKDVDLLFRKAVSFKPEERFASPMELALALSEAAGGGSAARLKQAGQTAPGLTPIDRPRPAEAPKTASSAAVAPVAPAAPTPSKSVPPPPKAGDVSVREHTEEVEDDSIQDAEEISASQVIEEPAPSLRVPKKESREDITDPRAMPAVEPKAEAPKAEPAKTEPPKKAEAKSEPAPAKKGDTKPKAEAKGEPAPAKKGDTRPKAEAKSEPAPAKKGDTRPKAEVAKTDPAPAKKPKDVSPAAEKVPGPKVPPPQKPDNTPKIVAAVLVLVIIGMAVYLGLQDEGGAPKKKPVPPPPAPVAAVQPAPAEAVDAGAPAQVAENPTPAPQANPEPAKKDDKQEKAEKLAAEKAAKEQEKADKLAAEKAAREQEKADKAAALAAEKAAKEQAKADKLAAEKAAKEEAAKKKAEEDAMKRLAEADAKKKADEEAAKKKAEDDAKKGTVVAASTGGGCPSGMRLIPAGTFKFGAPDSDDLKNFGDLDVSDKSVAAFCIDVLESPNKTGARPTTGVSFKEAEASCKKQKKRLCHEEEWERACKGPSNWRFPYGKNFDAAACNTADADKKPRDLASAGSSAKCISGFGVFDLAGNVAEWTDSAYEDGGSEKAVKGGSAERPDYDTRCAARARKSPGTKDKLIGFRCCADSK